MKTRLVAAALCVPAGISFNVPLAVAQDQVVEAVVVTAARLPQPLSETIADVTVLDRRDIERTGSLGTVAELLARQPGVQFGRAGGRGAAESVYIRGTNGTHALVLVDGMRVGSATSGATSLEMIPLSQIERIEIVRGPVSALYGSDAIGGVVQIFTRSGPNSPAFAADAGFGTDRTYAASARYRGQVDRLTYGIRFGVDGTDGINAIQSPDNPAFNDDKDGYKNRSIGLDAAYAISPDLVFSVDYFRAEGRSRFDGYKSLPAPLYTPVDSELDYKSENMVDGLGVRLDYAVNDIWETGLKYLRGRDWKDSPEAMVGGARSVFQTAQKNFQWQNSFTFDAGAALLGFERLEQNVDSSGDFALKKRSIDSVLFGWSGEIRQHDYRMNVRLDDNSQFGKKATWLAGYGYRFSPHWRMLASYGTAFKAPSMNDLYYPYTPGLGGGNASLRPEESRTGEVSLRYEREATRAALTIFDNKIQDLISWATNSDTFESSPENIGKARIKGVELSAQTALHSWTVGANLTLQDPQDESVGQRLRRRAKSFGTLFATYAGARASGTVEMQLVGSRFDDPHWRTGINQVRMGGYGLVNVYGEYSISRGVVAYARINNLFDKEYDIARSVTTIYGTEGLNAFVGIRYTLR